MTRPERGSGPRIAETAPKLDAGQASSSLEVYASAADNVEARAGDLLRITSSRDVRCVCSDCDLVVANTGAAASHARSARHTMIVNYATTFALIPREIALRSVLNRDGAA